MSEHIVQNSERPLRFRTSGTAGEQQPRDRWRWTGTRMTQTTGVVSVSLTLSAAGHARRISCRVGVRVVGKRKIGPSLSGVRENAKKRFQQQRGERKQFVVLTKLFM